MHVVHTILINKSDLSIQQPLMCTYKDPRPRSLTGRSFSRASGVLQNQFEDASDDDDDDDDTTTTAAAAASTTGEGSSTTQAPAKGKSNNNRSKSNKNSGADRAAASLFFSDSTAPRHR